MAYEIKGKAISIGVNDSWQIAVDDVSSSTYDSSMGALGSSNRRAIIVPPGSYNQGVTMREYVDIYEEVPGGTINTGVIVNTVGSGYYISGDSLGDGCSSSGNTLTVSSVGGAGDRFATEQAAYDHWSAFATVGNVNYIKYGNGLSGAVTIDNIYCKVVLDDFCSVVITEDYS